MAGSSPAMTIVVIGSLARRALDLLGRGEKAFPLQLLAGELAGAADGLGLLARLALGGLFIMAAQFHFPEDALALHFLLEGLERLVDVVVANDYLHEQTFVFECFLISCTA